MKEEVESTYFAGSSGHRKPVTLLTRPPLNAVNRILLYIAFPKHFPVLYLQDS